MMLESRKYPCFDNGDMSEYPTCPRKGKEKVNG
jgi:hypothetical protein